MARGLMALMLVGACRAGGPVAHTASPTLAARDEVDGDESAPAEAPCPESVEFCGSTWPSTSQNVRCDDPSVTDLSPLRCLANLRHLGLEDVSVSSLEPLAGLKHVESLHLENVPLTDLEAIAAWRSLVSLGLDAVPITAIDVVAGLLELEYVELRHLPVRRIAPLAALPKLKTLELSGIELAPGEFEAFSRQRPDVNTD